MSFDSFLHLYQKSYYNLPPTVKIFLGSLYGNIPLSVRFGKNYTLHDKLLRKFESADEQFKLDFQYNKTVETLQFAQDHIPYYQKLFHEHGFDVANFKELNDLKKLPYLTKEIIQKELQNLHTDKFDNPVAYYTGGSSSVPMQMFAPMSVSRSKEKAYTNYIFSKIGYNYRDKMVSIGGRGNPDESKGIYWDYQTVDNMLLISVNHLEKRFIEPILHEVTKYKPKFFYGYPSGIISFIKAAKSIGVDKIDDIQGIIFASESVFPEHIALAQEFFGARVLSHFGHTERVVVASRIDNGAYHFYNAYGLTRIVNDEIVGTSFDNIVMPYINYKTKDYIDGDRTYYPGTDIVKEASMIQGRIQEYVITKDNDPITILSIGAGHYDSYDHVEQAQFYQDTPGKVILYLQSQEPEKVKVQTILDQMHKQVKNKIDFEIKFKDKIEKSKRGKRILCIQKLDIEQYRNK